MNLQIWPIISVSLNVALCSTVLVMVCSLFLANLFVKSKWKIIKILEIVIYLPMALPPVALGYGLLLLLGPHSVTGRMVHNYFGVDIAFSFAGAVIAAFSVSLGIGVRTARLAIEQVDKTQIHIAALIGAHRRQIFWYIVLPQCFPAMLGGAILVFIRALSEFGATIVLAGNTLGKTRTLALAIWVGMETPGKERECLVLVGIAVVISLLALISTEILLRRNNK